LQYNPVVRLLHCHSGNLFGGVERALLALEASPQPRLQSEYALCFEGRFAEALRAARIDPRLLGSVRFRFPWTVWSARRRLAGCLARSKPDWILTHGLWSFRLAYPVAKSTGTKIALWVHDVFQGESWLEKKITQAPDRIFATSRFTAEAVPNVFPGRWPELLPPPLGARQPDDAARSRVRTELGAAKETVVILIAGRFERLKGHAMLLGSLGRMAVSLPASLRWNVWIAGEAQRPEERKLQEELKAQAEKLGGRVKFLGYRSDIAALYAGADIYCQPNVGPEAYGLTLAEAGAAGLPVVTSRLGAAPEIVDNDVGRLVPPGDDFALSAVLGELISSRELRRKLGGEALRRARSLPSAQAVLERLTGLLEGSFVNRRLAL